MTYTLRDSLGAISGLQLTVNILHLPFDLHLAPVELLANVFIRPSLGIAQSIVDMNRGIKPDLTIVDGSVGQHGEGPLYGDKADLQVLVAGRDSLAVDLACCRLVGVNPRTIPHLKLALEQLGSPIWTQVGEETGVIKQFRLPEQKKLYRFIFWLMYPLDYPYSWIAADFPELAGQGAVCGTVWPLLLRLSLLLPGYWREPGLPGGTGNGSHVQSAMHFSRDILCVFHNGTIF